MESRTTIVDLMSVVVCRIRPSIHAASERLIDRIDAFLGHPAVDPHGDPIPCVDGSLTEIQGTSLSKLRPGQRFRVVRGVMMGGTPIGGASLSGARGG
jgi:hypothetical protein